MKKEMKEEIQAMSCYFCEKLTSDFEFFESLEENSKNELIKAAKNALEEYDTALRKLNAWACQKNKHKLKKAPWNKSFLEEKFRVIRKRKSC